MYLEELERQHASERLQFVIIALTEQRKQVVAMIEISS